MSDPCPSRLTETPKLVDPTETLNVRLALAEAESARAIVSRERAAAASDITVELGAKRFQESRDTAVVLGLSMPIPIFDRNQGNIAAGLITASFETGWYFGGINGAGLAAQEFNQRMYEVNTKEIMFQNRLFPIFHFTKSF